MKKARFNGINSFAEDVADTFLLCVKNKLDRLNYRRLYVGIFLYGTDNTLLNKIAERSRNYLAEKSQENYLVLCPRDKADISAGVFQKINVGTFIKWGIFNPDNSRQGF